MASRIDILMEGIRKEIRDAMIKWGELVAACPDGKSWKRDPMIVLEDRVADASGAIKAKICQAISEAFLSIGEK